jgi:ribosomal protein L11 methylase PrmA
MLLPYPFARLGSISIAYFWNFAMKELVIFRRKERVPLARILRLYSGLSFGEVVYMSIRFATAPIGKIVRLLPEHGNVLEIGMGSAINLAYASQLHPNCSYYGVDADPAKLLLAKKLTAQNISVKRNLTLLTSRYWEAVLIVDLLYLLDAKAREKLLVDCVSTLTEDGVLIVKEMSAKPRLKVWWNSVQEKISVRFTRMTYSNDSGINVWAVEDIATFATSKGFQAHITRLDNHYIHPHAVVEIRK